MRSSPHIYELTCFDASGQVIEGKPEAPSVVLNPELEREVQFMDEALRHGAHSYAVRHVPADEVRSRIRSERRQAFLDSMTSGIMERVGVSVWELFKGPAAGFDSSYPELFEKYMQ